MEVCRNLKKDNAWKGLFEVVLHTFSEESGKT